MLLNVEGTDLGVPLHRCQGVPPRRCEGGSGEAGAGQAVGAEHVGAPPSGVLQEAAAQPGGGSLRVGRAGKCADIAVTGQIRGRGPRWKSSDEYGPRASTLQRPPRHESNHPTSADLLSQTRSRGAFPLLLAGLATNFTLFRMSRDGVHIEQRQSGEQLLNALERSRARLMWLACRRAELAPCICRGVPPAKQALIQ